MKIKLRPRPFSLERLFEKSSPEEVCKSNSELGNSTQGGIRILNFQPADVILEGEPPIALSYAQTAFHLIIHTKLFHPSKAPDFIAVSQLTLRFTSQGNSYTVEHYCGMKNIFPLLDFTSRFEQFSYEFEHHDSNSDCAEYQRFVEEQINNHLRYGVHLLVPPQQQKKNLIFAGVYAAILAFFTYFSPNNRYFLATLLIGVLLAMGWAVGHYFWIKHKLKRFKK